MYKRKEFDSAIVVLLLLCCSVFIFSITNAFIEQNKQSIQSKAMKSSLIVEIVYQDETIGKGTAQLIDSQNAISVAHLFSKGISNINCYFYDKKQALSAELVKLDENLDVALLKLDKKTKVGHLKFVKKQNINYGKPIFKIGNALGYGLSIDEGIISNPYLKMNISGIERELISISIPINSGDSGGGVFDENGNYIGMISFKTSPTTVATDSMSFIIPSYVIYDFINA